MKLLELAKKKGSYEKWKLSEDTIEGVLAYIKGDISLAQLRLALVDSELIGQSGAAVYVFIAKAVKQAAEKGLIKVK